MLGVGVSGCNIMGDTKVNFEELGSKRSEKVLKNCMKCDEFATGRGAMRPLRLCRPVPFDLCSN